MPINLDDPRARKTRRNFQEALLRLILKHGFDSVTVQDIATEAEAARVTFYRHYRDKTELLSDCLNALYTDLVQKAEMVSQENIALGYSPATILYEHIEQNQALYRLLFSSQGTQTVIERMRYFMATRAQQNMQAFLEDRQPDVPLDLMAQYAASAQMGLAMWWLEQNMPYSARYMAQVALWLSLSGFLKAMGVTDVTLPAPPLD